MKYKLANDTQVSIKPITKYGQLYTIGDFVQQIVLHNIVDYDGFVRFVVVKEGQHYELNNVTYSIHFDTVFVNDTPISGIVDFARYNNISCAIWYNR